jgi:hypothetical protein
MVPIGIQVSNDDGATFSTALTFDADKLRVSELNEASNATIAVTGKKYPRKFTYLRVMIQTEMDFFDPSDAVHGAAADANWSALEDICKGLLIRIYNNNTTANPNLDGHTEFNASNNTAYLLLESHDPIYLDYDQPGANGKKRRYMNIELITQMPI